MDAELIDLQTCSRSHAFGSFFRLLIPRQSLAVATATLSGAAAAFLIGVSALVPARQRVILDEAGNTSSLRWRSAAIGLLKILATSAAAWSSLPYPVAQLLWIQTRRRERKTIAAGPGPIFYVNPLSSDGTKFGGAHAHAQGTLAGFSELGRRVTALMNIGGIVTDDNIQVYRWNEPAVITFPPEVGWLSQHRHFLRDARAAMPGDCAAIYQRHSLAVWTGAVLARVSARPLILEYNGPELWIAAHWGRPLRLARLFAWAEKINLDSADLIVTVSQPLKDELTGRGIDPSKIHVQPNGVSVERFAADTSSAKLASIRARLNIPPDAIVATFVGSFGIWHGVDIFAAAIAELARREAIATGAIHGLFIGEGPARVQAEAAVADYPHRVRFLGQVPAETIPEFLAVSDILVAPQIDNPDGSVFFGSPIKLFEYLAAGRAIVATQVGQIAEILAPDDGKICALLVPPRNCAALAAAIHRLAAHPEIRAAMGVEGRRRAQSRHSWKAHAGGIIQAAIDRGLLAS